MHPFQHAAEHPDRPAYVLADTGEQLTYGELDAGSNRIAQLFRRLGLKPGDVAAVLLKNGPAFPTAYWAAQRSGLMTTPISTHLKPAEAAYILKDCGAKVLITSAEVGETAVALAKDSGGVPVLYVGDEALEGARSLAEAVADLPATPVADEISGYYLVYSGGTTGRPKGVVLPFTPGPIDAESEIEQARRRQIGHFDPLVTFSGAPMYHAAPLMNCMTTHRMGGTVVMLKKFEPKAALAAIQDWRATYAQMVPTMFVRLLSLPEEVRQAYDLSSLRMLVHAAAPCPVAVKRQMIDWVGPILEEYYSGSEAIGQTSISSEEWLKKPGSVGRASWGTLHICGEEGEELPAGEAGLIYFEGPGGFVYRNDPEKTAKSRHPKHSTWASLGDIGVMDEDGYLFLRDRKDFMIISGGVNIYPQPVEDVLIQHPAVMDAAVVGVPSDEFGEAVKAVVQLAPGFEATPGLADELMAFCRARLSAVSCPRSVDFADELPRLPTGKLAKHSLRAKYWPQGAAPGHNR